MAETGLIEGRLYRLEGQRVRGKLDARRPLHYGAMLRPASAAPR
jgi:hypothetical protein